MYLRISKQLGSNMATGSFQPMLAALKASADKLAAIHNSTLAKVNELVKELVRYSEELHKKHKQIKVLSKLFLLVELIRLLFSFFSTKSFRMKSLVQVMS